MIQTILMETCGFDPRWAEKRAALFSSRGNTYPHTFSLIHRIGEVRAQADQTPEIAVRLADRIWARRGMGRALFMELQDHTGQVQLYCIRQALGEGREALSLLDLGNILVAEGTVFRTRTGELSVAGARLHLAGQGPGAHPHR
ncbi:MAG: hypothetical protein FJY95_10795 [Candidatus Handelsmanbacteria bacterium]|nr:hypothetical protein [Candidatus Handelsmanbacteria bacterium]